MSFTLRHLLVALTTLAVACAVVAPYFLPTKHYTTDCSTGTMSGWMYGTVHASTTVRGNGMPTIVLGNAGSEFTALGMEQLPFAFVLLHENNRQFDVQSSATFLDDTGPRSTTAILSNGSKLVVEYKLHAVSTGDSPEIIEALEIDGTEHDLSKGRLFTIDGKLNVVQEPLAKIDRSVLPPYAEGDDQQFSNFLEWWASVRTKFSLDAG